jgi:hypothetical protein
MKHEAPGGDCETITSEERKVTTSGEHKLIASREHEIIMW